MELTHVRQNCVDTVKAPMDTNNGDQNNNNNNKRHTTMDNKEEYEYESVLAKILNEKKLALSNSPEVIKFLRDVKYQNGAAGGNLRRVIM